MIGTKIGIDIGTNNLRVFVLGQGLVFDEPSVVACDSFSGKPLFFGNEAAKMFGKAPNSYSIIKPIEAGALSNLGLTRSILTHFVDKICRYKYLKPNILVGIHGGLSKLEKRIILDAVYSADAARVFFIEEPLAALMGAGTALNDVAGNLIVNIGAGTTEAAVVSMGRVAKSHTIKTAGNSLDRAIEQYLIEKFGISVGLSNINELKHNIGGAVLHTPELAIIINGKHQKTQKPQSFEINSSEIFKAIEKEIKLIAEGIRELIEKTPPEFMADICEKGIMLTGGSAKLFGIDVYLQRVLSLPVKISKEPELSVIKGIGYALQSIEKHYESGKIKDLESLKEISR